MGWWDMAWTVLLFQVLEIEILILLSVAFYTLLERKMLGGIHIRMGPNKVGLAGLAQPFSDALKLLSKTNSLPVNSGIWGFVASPFLSFFIPLWVWVVFPVSWGVISMQSGILLLFCYFSVTAYPLIYSGWFSNSKYATLGAIRSVAMTISYEIPLVFGMMSALVMSGSLSVSEHVSYSNVVNFWLSCVGSAILLVICLVVETGRNPFDLAEGESELVSGYSVEYGGGLYVLVFLAEYVSMFFAGAVVSVIFFSGSLWVVFAFVLLMAWVRASMPRTRFDFMMWGCWVVLIPVSVAFFWIDVSFLMIL